MKHLVMLGYAMHDGRVIYIWLTTHRGWHATPFRKYARLFGSNGEAKRAKARAERKGLLFPMAGIKTAG